jgi:L-ascorbate metabolism protein UlaG (beta-lactamase superfamily)
MQKLAITWLGHSAFRVRTPGGVEILFDPWFTGNPKFPGTAHPTKADLILVSHGHSDHITDAAAMARQTGATVVGIFEVVSWLGSKGVQAIEPMNKGG